MAIRNKQPNVMAQLLKVLTFSLACIYWQQASAACPVHNHLCTFHALGAQVNVTTNVPINTTDSLVIYAIGKDPVGGAASTVDFDNEVKLPTYTGDKFLTGSPVNYTTSAGPYIVNSTAYGATHPPGTWSVPGDSGLQVTPSQYKNTFNANTAVARHTGDFNGGENGNIPGATGCPNMPGAANCEAVVVTGNVPSGVYEQKVRLFNFYGVPDPKVDLQVGAYVTGQLVMVSNSHDTREIAYFPKLEGDKNTTATYAYEIYNRGFDPHAYGVATFDRTNWGKVRDGAVNIQNGHRFLTLEQPNSTTRTTVYGDTGRFTENTWANKPRVVGHVDLGEVPHMTSTSSALNVPGFFDSLAPFKQGNTPWNAAISMPNTKVPYAPGVDVAAIEASNALAGWRLNQPNNPYMFDPNYTGAMTGPGTLIDGRQAWMSNPYYVPPKATTLAQQWDIEKQAIYTARQNMDAAVNKAAVNIVFGGLKGISLVPLGVASFATRVVGSTDYIGEENETADTLDKWNSWVGRTFDQGAVRITNGAYNPDSILSVGSSIVAPLFLASRPAIGGANGRVGAGSFNSSAPWLDEVTKMKPGGTFLQCGNGSCVSATAQNITGGTVTEAQMVREIGEWSNSESLARALNQSGVNGGKWIGGMVSDANTLALANKGIIGAELQVPGQVAHMVAIKPIPGAPGTFHVMDTGVGASYTVDSAWILKYVSKVVAQP